jgi:Putative silver efflux pump
MAGAAGLVLLTIVFARMLGLEFLPKLEEGNLWIRAVMPPTITLEAGMETVAKIRAIIRAIRRSRPCFPSRDAARRHRSRRLVSRRVLRPLKPADKWPSGLTKEQMVKQMSEAQPRIRRRRFQFLAIHPGQYRGSRLGC